MHAGTYFKPDLKSVAALIAAVCSVVTGGPPAILAEETPERPEIVLQFAQHDVESADISPDGRLLATGGSRGEILLWDLETGRRLRRLRGHLKPVRGIQFTPDGSRLLSVSMEEASGHDSSSLYRHHKAALWDVASGNLLHAYAPTWLDHLPEYYLPLPWRGFLCAGFAPDGRHFVAGDPDNNLVLIDGETGRRVRSYRGFSGRTWMHDAAIDSSGQFVVGVDSDALIVWNLKTGGIVNRLPPLDPEWSCRFALSGDGKVLVMSRSKSDPKHFTFWELATGRKLRRIEQPGKGVFRMALNHDGSQLLAESLDVGAVLLDTRTGKQLGRYKPRYHIDLVKFVDGRPLALGDDLRLVDVQTGELKFAIDAPRAGYVEELVFSSDGKRFAIGKGAGASLWDAATGECRISTFRTSGFSAYHLAFTPDDRFLLGGTHKYRDGAAVFLWDTQSGNRVPRFSPDVDNMTAVAVSENGRAMTASRDGTVHVWDVASGEIAATLVQPRNEFKKSGSIYTAAFSHNGRYVATYGYSVPRLVLWDLSAERPRQVALHGIPDTFDAMLDFDPRDERLLAVSDEGTVYSWDLRTGHRTAEFSLRGKRFFDAKFLPDGEHFATASSDDRVQIVNLERKSVVRVLKQGFLGEMAVSPDGRRLLTASYIGTTWLWDIESGRVLAGFYFFDGGREWLTITTDGYFDGTPAARSIVMRRTGNDLFAVEPCDDFYQPERVVEALRQTGD